MNGPLARVYIVSELTNTTVDVRAAMNDERRWRRRLFFSHVKLMMWWWWKYQHWLSRPSERGTISGLRNSFNCLGHFKDLYDDDDDNIARLGGLYNEGMWDEIFIFILTK